MVHHGEAKRQSIGSATFCVCPYDTANPSLPMKRPQVSSHSIPSSSGGAIDAHVFEPYTDAADAASRSLVIRGTIVLVIPLPALGGGEHNTIGPRRQWWRAVTFALESISPGGDAVVVDIIESLARGGADRGQLRPRDVPLQDPIIVVIVVG